MRPIAFYASFVFCLLLPLRSVTAAEPMLPYTRGLDVSAMNRSVSPCVDFYQYACGGWQRRNPIPPDQTSWSVYSKMADENLAFLRGVLEQAAAGVEPDPVSQKIGDYYAACMDEARVEQLGATALGPDLAAIEQAASTTDLAALLARLQREAVNRSVLFEPGSDQDPTTPSDKSRNSIRAVSDCPIETIISGTMRNRRKTASDTWRTSRRCCSCSAMRPMPLAARRSKSCASRPRWQGRL
jgi:hypothetical protein